MDAVFYTPENGFNRNGLYIILNSEWQTSIHFFNSLLEWLDRLLREVTIHFRKSWTNINLEEMRMSDVMDKVKEVIVDVMKVDPDEVQPETRFIEDLKADSMDQFFLIDGFCEKFDINIADEEARDIKTVADVVAFVDKISGK
jgi:acyl carrier protein